MIAVDTSVWVDLFADRPTIQTAALRDLILSGQPIVVGDLVLAEVLQGARDERHAEKLRTQLGRYAPLTIGGQAVAVQAARNYRILRTKGVTIRKTIDTLIATRCIVDGLALLYSDRDFDPFVQHLDLRSALDFDTGVN